MSGRTILFSLVVMLVVIVGCGAYVYLSNTEDIKRMAEKDGVTRFGWVVGFGRPVMSSMGYSITETRKTGKGHDDEEVRKMDTEGNLVQSTKGAAIERYRGWKEDGWACAEVRYFGKDEKPCKIEGMGFGMSGGMTVGNVLLFTEPGWGTLCKEGIGEAHEGLSEKTFLGQDGKPMVGEEGMRPRGLFAE